MGSVDSIVELEKAWKAWETADRKAAGKPPRQKGGVLGKVIGGTKKVVLDYIGGAAIGLLIAGAVAMPLRYAATVPIANLGNSSVAASALSPADRSLQMEIGDIYSFLTIAKQDAGDSLKAQGIDLSGTAYTVSELEQLAVQAAPFVVRELGHDRVNFPNFVVRPHGHLHGFYALGLRKGAWWNTAGIAPGLSRPAATAAVTHELTHAQILAAVPYKLFAGLLFGGTSTLFVGPQNETFAELTTLEVLANQALQGDTTARYAVLDRLTYGLELEMRRQTGEELSHDDVRYFQTSALTVLQALAGRKESYHGVRLDGITRLVNEEIRALQPIN